MVSIKIGVTPFLSDRCEVIMIRNFDPEALLGTIPAVFFKGYKDWSVDFLDNRIERMTGYPAAAFQDRELRWSDIVVPEDLDSLRQRVRAAWKTDQLYVREYRIHTRSGQTLWIQERSQIILDDQGDIEAIAGFFFDISERKALEQELAKTNEQLKHLNLNLEQEIQLRSREILESERRFRTLFHNTKDIMLIADHRFVLESVNPSALNLLQYDSEESLLGKPLATIFASDESFERWRKRLLTKGFLKDWQLRLRRQDGEGLEVAISADVLENEDGEPQRIHLIARDMSEWLRMTGHWLQTEKMATIGQMAAGIAHEMNTPLMIILAHAQLLQDDFDPDNKTFGSLKTVEGQIHICRRIVSDLLQFSRVEAAVSEVVNIQEGLDEVIRLLDHSLELDRIEVVTSCADRLLQIKGDPDKLQSVYINLINNAHQAIGTDGVIFIGSSYDETSHEAQIVVADSGPGIAEEIRDRLFEPFFTTKEVSKGTGLGLSLVQAIMREHGGSIRVDCPTPELYLNAMRQASSLVHGTGAAFTIRLPVSLPDN